MAANAFSFVMNLSGARAPHESFPYRLTSFLHEILSREGTQGLMYERQLMDH